MHYRRQALVMPPTMTSDGAHKFAMFMLKAVLDGRASRGSAARTLLIRPGRSAYKRELLKRLWALLQNATGAPDDRIVLGIQEVPRWSKVRR
jgi:hypothetical protein